MTLAGKVTAAALRTDFDAKTATVQSNARGGGKDHDVVKRLASLADTDALVARSYAWTQQDDAELRVIGLRVTDGTAGRVVNLRLTVDNGDDTFLEDDTVIATITTVNGTVDARVDFRTTTGVRLRLLRGVRYRLALENTTGSTTVAGPLLGFIQTRCIRRRR